MVVRVTRQQHMRKIVTAILVVLLSSISGAAALEFTSPQPTNEINESPAQIFFQWDQEIVNGTLAISQNDNLLHSSVLINQTNYTRSLEIGNYTARLNASNQSAQLDFEIILESQENETQPAPEPLQLEIAVSKSEYEVGENVHITATSSQETQAKLEVLRESQVEETYTLNIQESIQLIYIPEEPGSYQLKLTKDASTSTTSFQAKQTDPLEVEVEHTDAVVDKKTVFTAEASGGKPPYTYDWSFSDDTTSTGKTTNHYFFEGGEQSASVLVTDADGDTVEETVEFDVNINTFKISITVLEEETNIPQEGLKVTLNSSNQSKQDTTSEMGDVEFSDVKGEYLLTIRKANTTHINETINVDEDDNLLYRIPKEAEPEEQNQSETQEPEPTPPEPEDNNTQPVQQIAPVEPEVTSQEVQEAEELEDYKQEKIAEVRDAKFNYRLEPKVDSIMQLLKLYPQFDEAQEQIRAANNKQEIDVIVGELPSQVRITDESTQLIYPEPDDLEEPINQYIEAKGVADESLRKSYIRSFEMMSEKSTIKETRTQARITYDDREETVTHIRKQVTATQAAEFIEIIPQTFARGTQDLRLTGDYEIVDEGIISFKTNNYEYATTQSSNAPIPTLVLPNELQEAGGLSGLMSVVVDTSMSGVGIAALIISVLIVGGVAGKKTVDKKGQKKNFEEFAQITHQALDLIDAGEAAKAAQITPDILSIYNTLNADQQESLKPVMDNLLENASKEAMLTQITSVYHHISEKPYSINTITPMYEQTLTQFESLPPLLQEQLRGHMDQLQNHINETIA